MFLSKQPINDHLSLALSSLNSLVSPNAQLDLCSIPTSQKQLSRLIDQESFKTFSTQFGVLDKARLLCCAMPHASAWIRALPTKQNKLSASEWVISMKRWLGVPFFNSEHLCCACKNEAMDVFAIHASVCPVSGDRIKRHNAIRDCFFDSCSAACWGPIKEKPFLLPGSSEKPADILIPNYSGGKDLAIDFAVTCPLQSKYLRDSAITSGHACNSYALEIKSNNFEQRVQQQNMEYLPIILETFGGFSSESLVFINKLTNSISLRYSESRASCANSFFEKVSCLLMKLLARSISSRFEEFSHDQ